MGSTVTPWILNISENECTRTKGKDMSESYGSKKKDIKEYILYETCISLQSRQN